MDMKFQMGASCAHRDIQTVAANVRRATATLAGLKVMENALDALIAANEDRFIGPRRIERAN